MTDENTPDAEKEGFSFKKSLPLLILAALIAAAFYFDLHTYLSLQTVAENRETLTGFVASNIVIAIAVFIAIYVAVVALSLPGGALMTITSGFLFGPVFGGLTAVVGATIGATIIFLIAKTSFGEPLAARAGPWLEKLRDGFRKDALSYLLFLRLVPAFPFWLVNLAPAVLGVGLSTYAIGTFVGIIPGTFAFAFVGAGLDSIIEAQQASFDACVAEKGADGGCTFALDPGSLLTPEILIAFAALGVVALIPVVIRRIRDRKSAA